MRLLLILPYFGTLPNYFQQYLNSCAHNSDICDWLIFTDDKTKYIYPDNVKVYYCSFQEIQNRIKNLFPFSVRIDRPYKLCDYKPAYGFIFENEIRGYDYWGHCDPDIIWGKFSHFFNSSILSHDRVMRLGHLCLYKNTFENNRRFMLPIKGKERYKEVFTNPDNCIFDEYNSSGSISIDDIWNANGFSAYINDDIIANPHYKRMRFHLGFQREKSQYYHEPAFQYVFIWDNGELYRLYQKGRLLCKQEFLYIHLMKRKMNVSPHTRISVAFKIIPNEIKEIDHIPQNIEELKRVKKWHLNAQYFISRYKNLIIKLKRLLGR